MSEDGKSRKINTLKKAGAGTLGSGDDEQFELPAFEEDAILTGAAADSADLAERLKGLPRILRLALLIDSRDSAIYDRLMQTLRRFARNCH